MRSADILPTNTWIFTSRLFSSSKATVSFFCRLKARITRTPSRFSRVVNSTRSSWRCTFLYNGMLTSRMPNTTMQSTGIVTANTMAVRTSTVNAMIMAPNTTKGDRSSRRRVMFTPFCTWLMSLVMRVISVEVPTVSISA